MCSATLCEDFFDCRKCDYSMCEKCYRVAAGPRANGNSHALAAGAQVRVCGLKQTPGLNGEVGTLEHFIEASGRWQVLLESGTSKALKADNLQLVCQAYEHGDAFQAGVKVRICGLNKTSALNGQIGVLEHFVEASGRWQVVLDSGSSKAIKTENLELVSEDEDEVEHLDEEFCILLSYWLQELKLERHFKATEGWVIRMGAMSLEDVVSNVAELAEELPLKPLETKRLRSDARMAAMAARGRREQEEEAAAQEAERRWQEEEDERRRRQQENERRRHEAEAAHRRQQEVAQIKPVLIRHSVKETPQDGERCAWTCFACKTKHSASGPAWSLLGQEAWSYRYSVDIPRGNAQGLFLAGQGYLCEGCFPKRLQDEQQFRDDCPNEWFQYSLTVHNQNLLRGEQRAREEQQRRERAEQWQQQQAQQRVEAEQRARAAAEQQRVAAARHHELAVASRKAQAARDMAHAQDLQQRNMERRAQAVRNQHARAEEELWQERVRTESEQLRMRQESIQMQGQLNRLAAEQCARRIQADDDDDDDDW